MSNMLLCKKPIVTGKLNFIKPDMYTITGHLGDVLPLTQPEYTILKKMEGFLSFSELAEALDIDVNVIVELYDRLKGEKKIALLEDWNQIGWCSHCKTYVAGDTCGCCGEKVSKIVFAPPCDPWICLDEERKFIVNILREHFGVDMPDELYLLANNGVRDNKFFWEICYMDRIIMRIDFATTEEEGWKYTLLVESRDLKKCEKLCFTKESLEKTIKANKKRQEQLFTNSAAFIKESLNFYNTKPLIYFSGGKESLVMYSIFDRLNIEANVITVAPGVDFPDDVEFTLNFKKSIEANPKFKYYFYQGDGQNVLDTLKKTKVLSANNPWCRVDFKKGLKNKGTQEIYNGEDFVACEGSRWYENDFRRRHPKVNLISGYPHQLWIHPIAEWTSFDVWIYIFENSIPLNPIYYKGFQRTTCWLCPIVNPFHLRCSRKYYPELWAQISDCKLEAFGEDTSKDLPF